ncbi:hypothetical protein JCM21900_006746 [Sporobolomyces salmonicolor]
MLPRASQLRRALPTPRIVARAKSTAAVSSASSAPAASSRDATTSQSTTPQADEAPLNATSAAPTTKQKVKSPTDPAFDYQRRLEERFGGGEAAALGNLVDGKPEGLARHVKKNMFRLI